MNQIKTVFSTELKLLWANKGTLFFNLVTIIVAVIIFPLFMKDEMMQFTYIIIFSFISFKSFIAETFVREKESKTLESLLSTPIKNSTVVIAKALFICFYQTCFLGLGFVVLCFTKLVILDGFLVPPLIIVISIIASLTVSYAAAICGTYISAISENSKIANKRLLILSYIAMFSLIILLSVIFTGITSVIIICTLVWLAAAAVITLFFVRLIFKIKRKNFMKTKTAKKGTSARVSGKGGNASRVSSQFMTVFVHEWKYFMTLKRLRLHWVILMLAPSIFMCLLYYNSAQLNLDYAVLTIAFLIPRIPVNLVAYSIGGERVYKTGESLLSTPVHVRQMFFGKSLIPILSSTVIMTAASLLAVLTAKLVSGRFVFYTASQLVLIFGVGLMSGISMIIITGVLTMAAKEARRGVNISAYVSFVFLAPALVIIYATNNQLLWSVIYTCILLLFNLLALYLISDRIKRPQLMTRL